MIASIEWFAYNPPNTVELNDSNGNFPISIFNEDLITHPRKTYLELRGKVNVVDGDNKVVTPLNLDLIKVTTCGWLHLFDRIDYYIADNKIDTVRKPGIVTLMKGLASFQTDKMYCDAGWDLDVASGQNTLKTNGWFHAMIPMSIILGFNEDHKSFIYNMPQRMVFYRNHTSVNDIFQLSGDYLTKYKVAIELRHVTLNVPHIKFDLEHTTKVRNEIMRNAKYELKYRRWFYNSHTPPVGTDFTWDIPISYAKTKYVLIAFQTNRTNMPGADISKFDFCDLENCQVLLNNNIYYPHQPLGLCLEEHRCGTLYNMFKRFKGSYYSKEDDLLQPIVTYQDFLTNYPLIVIDCSHQPTVLKESLINMKIFFNWRKPIPEKTIIHCIMIVDDKAIYSPLTGNVFHT